MGVGPLSYASPKYKFAVWVKQLVVHLKKRLPAAL
ncbi:hypothetical protein T02_11153 [Trichinella nativa]|uniref:Uncharacterized protein n=2 Tax=Trichinella TaxID=6333 RepID=A0A0V1BP39_TRIBR|nr:hypothetical protein T03_12632 [Trichinella britovi]KRY41072.1 hypothetical protein T03_11319 [Trichinella britovi]KRZ46524.1 hypothetical protein T02_11153 [Trichinella nativa]